MKVTPVLFVEEIEPCLKLWVDRLGFEKTVEVPEGDKLGFVILVKDGAEVMLQTRASVQNDLPSMVEHARPGASLFIEVADFADLLRRVEGFEVTFPERTTFYGMREIGIREPGGNFLCFAARIET